MTATNSLQEADIPLALRAFCSARLRLLAYMFGCILCWHTVCTHTVQYTHFCGATVTVCRVTVMKNKETRESTGVAFILFVDRVDAQRTVSI